MASKLNFSQGVGRKAGRLALKFFLFIPPIIVFTWAFAAATRLNILPNFHKGKGLEEHSADEGEKDGEFWDYDTVRSDTSGGSVIMDRQDRLGLWLVRGDRSLPTPVEVTMLAFFDNSMKHYGGGKTGPAAQVTVAYDSSISPYT